MFITIQIPLVDYRALQDTLTKLDFPEWPNPDPEEANMLYFGKIFNKDDRYQGPWDGEKRYCDVSSVINFCGMQDVHFRKSIQEEWNASILFRRFQSDGRFLAKFELGFFDEFESTLNPEKLSADEIKKSLYDHINQYLLCPVKIKKGSRKFDKKNRYTDFVPLRYMRVTSWLRLIIGQHTRATANDLLMKRPEEILLPNASPSCWYKLILPG